MYFLVLQFCFLNIKATNIAEEYKLFLDEELGITEKTFNQEKYEEIVRKTNKKIQNWTLLKYFDIHIADNACIQIKYLEKQIDFLEKLETENMTKDELYIIITPIETHIEKNIYNLKTKTYSIVKTIYQHIKKHLEDTNSLINDSCWKEIFTKKYHEKLMEHNTLQNIRGCLDTLYIGYQTLNKRKNMIMQEKMDDIKNTYIVRIKDYKKLLSNIHANYNIITQSDCYDANGVKQTIIDEKIQANNKAAHDIQNAIDLTRRHKNDNDVKQLLQKRINLDMIKNRDHPNFSFDENITIEIDENMQSLFFRKYYIAIHNYNTFIIELETMIYGMDIEDLKNNRTTDIETQVIDIITKIDIAHLSYFIDCVYDELHDAVQKLNVANKEKYIDFVEPGYIDMDKKIKNIKKTKIALEMKLMCNEFPNSLTKTQMVNKFKSEIIDIIKISRSNIIKQREGIKIVKRTENVTDKYGYASNPDSNVPYKRLRMSKI
ncbi:hypothetical protein BDAP_000428 [Binucleata daphniae]